MGLITNSDMRYYINQWERVRTLRLCICHLLWVGDNVAFLGGRAYAASAARENRGLVHARVSAHNSLVHTTNAELQCIFFKLFNLPAAIPG